MCSRVLTSQFLSMHVCLGSSIQKKPRTIYGNFGNKNNNVVGQVLNLVFETQPVMRGAKLISATITTPGGAGIIVAAPCAAGACVRKQDPIGPQGS